MVQFIRNTSILTALLVGFLLASQLSAQEANTTSLPSSQSTTSSTSASPAVPLGQSNLTAERRADDDGRRPRGFLAALFGYPDEFEGEVPAASQAKSVAVDAPAMFRGSASGRSAKRLSSAKAVSIHAPKTSTAFKTTFKTTQASEDDAPTTTLPVTASTAQPEANTTIEEKSHSGNDTGNATEGATGQKREASPTKGNRGNRGQVPFGGRGHPLPAGYILWHPVPAPYFGGPDVPEHPLASHESPSVLPPRGGPGNFLPHRPLFVEPFSGGPGPFSHHGPGPFPITQFSSPPVFAVSPEEGKSGRGGKGRKKPAKGGKSKHRNKGRPADEEAEVQEEGDEDFRGPPRPRPVHVLLPPIPPNGFRGGPEFGFGNPNQQQQQFGDQGGPFPGAPFGNQQGPEQNQNLRQPNFDQQRAPQNVNGDFRGPPNGNFNKNSNNNNNNNNGFRGPANDNVGKDSFRSNDFRGPNNNLGGPGGNFGGNFAGPNSNFAGPNGNFAGPNGNFAGPNGNFAGPNGNFGGNFAGPNGNFRAPNGNFAGPNGNFRAPNGNFAGPNNNFDGPNSNFRAPNGNFGGPSGNFDGPNGNNFDGPGSQKPRRPSPSPSAHPAKFEIDHQKKMQEEFEQSKDQQQQHHQNRDQDVHPPPPPAPFLPPIVPPPIPPPANFPLPDFRFSSTLPPFSFSSPPPQFLDSVANQGFPGGPDFLPHPLPSPPPRSFSSSTPLPPPLPSPPSSAHHSVPALSLASPPPAGRFPDAHRGSGGHFASSTPQSLTDDFGADNGDGLIYTRDFKKVVDDVKPSSQSQFPVFSSADRQPQPSPASQTQHFGKQQRVQRFPAVQQGLTSFPTFPSTNSFNDRPAQQSSQGGESFQSFGDNQRGNVGGNDNLQNNAQDNRQNNFRNNGQGRRQSNRNRSNRPTRLPNTHPNLPDFKSELTPAEPQTQATTLQPFLEASTAGSFSVPSDNYASPGFGTGHKGYPSAVTTQAFEDGNGLSTTLAPRSRPTPKSSDRSKDAGQGYYGSTFRTSFASSPAGSRSKSGKGSVDYHYEIQYQSPVPAVATYSTTNPQSSSKKSVASSAMDSTAPEYSSSSVQAQGGSYKPGTSRILLEMGEWSNSKDGQVDSALAQEAHPYLQPSQ